VVFYDDLWNEKGEKNRPIPSPAQAVPKQKNKSVFFVVYGAFFDRYL